MATVLNDFAAGVTCRPTVSPGSYTEETAGTAADLLAGDGGAFAVLTVGTLAGGTTGGGHLEESANAQAWDAIPGAEFAAVTTAHAVRALTFRRTVRYVRAVLTVSGGSPQAYAAVVIGQGTKLV